MNIKPLLFFNPFYIEGAYACTDGRVMKDAEYACKICAPLVIYAEMGLISNAYVHVLR